MSDPHGSSSSQTDREETSVAGHLVGLALMARISGKILLGLAAVLIIVGTVSLVYSQKVTDRGVLSLHSLRYRSDFVFLAAAGSAVVGWGLTQPSWKRPRLARSEAIALISIGLYLVSCLSATLLARVAHGLWFDLVGFANLAKTFLGLTLSLVVYIYLRGSVSLYRTLVWALALPPLVPVALGIFMHLLQPTHQEIGRIFHLALGAGCYRLGDAVCGGRIPLLGEGERFQGFTANPLQVSFGLLTALSFLWPMTILCVYRRRWMYFAVGLVCAEFLIAGLLWTQARSAVIALVLILSFSSVLMFRRIGAGPVHYAGAVSVALVLFAGAWSLLPGGNAAVLITRFETTQPSAAHLSTQPSMAPLSTVGYSAVRVAPIASVAGPDSSQEAVSSNYGRLTIWKYYAVVAVHNILGVGFNYGQRFYAISANNERVTAHNNVLMTWMFGGVVATFGVFMLWWQLLRSIATGLRSAVDAEAFVLYLGVSGAFAGMWLLSATIGNLIGEFTFAILMAMVLAGPPSRHEGGAKTLAVGVR